MPKSCDQNYDELNEIKLTKQRQKYFYAVAADTFL